MNKGRRNELKMLKYKRRLKIYGLVKGIALSNNYKVWYALRSHGAPCSCYLCSHDKYNRASAKRSEEKQIHHDLTFWQSEFDNDDPMHLYYEKYSDIDIDIYLLPGELYKSA